jgi:hypothetical protein
MEKINPHLQRNDYPEESKDEKMIDEHFDNSQELIG